VFITIGLPSGDLRDERGLVGNATIETLRQKDADFGLGHLEPASMFWRLMPFEPLHEVSRFGGTRGFDCALT
jgi:hypothetical protein